jgi:hypothetical protein
MRSRASYENSLRASREAKRRRIGICKDCGAETRYNGHRGSTSEFCVDCAAKRIGEKLRGTGSLNRRIIDYLAEERRYMDICRRFDRTTPQMASQLNRLVRYGLIVRIRRGVYKAAS